MNAWTRCDVCVTHWFDNADNIISPPIAQFFFRSLSITSQFSRFKNRIISFEFSHLDELTLVQFWNLNSNDRSTYSVSLNKTTLPFFHFRADWTTMEIPIRLQILCTISLLLSVVHWANAQFYGSYGRSYFAPITFPQTPDNNGENLLSVISRVSDDFISPPTQQQIQAAAIAASKQISKGSEQFAFEMFNVSVFFMGKPKNQWFLFSWLFFLFHSRPLLMRFNNTMQILLFPLFRCGR